MKEGCITGSTDALIVGGGLAGAALGITLARQGQHVAIVEATRAAHDKVCGEFLSYEALGYLDRLGIDVQRLGAVPIERVRLVSKHILAEADLPFAAMSLTRRALDEAVLRTAAESGARVYRGHRAESLEKRENEWVAAIEGGTKLHSSTAFLATGKHDLHGRARPPGKQNELVAFKMYFRLSRAQQAALVRHVELLLFPGGYAGLQLVEDGVANFCLLITRNALKQAAGKWTSVLQYAVRSSKHLELRLTGAEPLLRKPLALAAIPYGFLSPAAPLDGLWRLGDQAAVIPSFSGDGMSIALHSSHLAASTYLAGGTAAAFHERLYSDLKRSVGVATLLSRLLIVAPGCAHLVQIWPALLRRFANQTRIFAPGFADTH